MFWSKARLQAELIAELQRTNEVQAARIDEMSEQIRTLQSEPRTQPGRIRRWVSSWKPPRMSAAELAAENEDWWFNDHLPSVRISWMKRITNRQMLHPNEPDEVTEREATKHVLTQAQIEYDKLDKELDKGLSRSNVIVGSAALIAALILGLVTIVLTQKVSINLPTLMIATGFIIASFLLNMHSMRPPLRRALTEPYLDQAEWTVLVVDDFTRWAMLTYSCRSRQHINTRYKKLHGIAITAFTCGVMFLVPAFSWPFIERFLAFVF